MSNVDVLSSEQLADHWKLYEPRSCFEVRVGLIREEDETFSVYAINLPGIASQGENEQQALENIRDALAGALSQYIEKGTIPWSDDFFDGEIVEKRVLVNLFDAEASRNAVEHE